MKKLPPTDRRSWAFQAAIHGTADPTYTDPLFNQCKHGTPHFFPWHRGYLYFFERILRWAANDPDLMLPFWDWTANPVLPEPFRTPASTTNPLYESKRKANDASALPSSVVADDLDIALAQTAFPISGTTGFSSLIEDTPHGAIHGLVGGLGGLMSSVPRAAGDPIFWLHHGNVDRLWNVWLNKGGGRVDPSDSTYLDISYTYANETGGTSTVKVRDIMNSTVLGYKYEGVPSPSAAYAAQESSSTVKVVKLDVPKVVATSGPTEAFEGPLDKLETKALGFEEKRVKLNVIKEARVALTQAVTNVPRGGSLGTKVSIAIEGLNADASPDFVYRVYVNLPEAERREEVLRSHYIGSINFFGKTKADRVGGGHGHAMPIDFTATFDATPALTRLNQIKRLDPDGLSVTILPTASVPPSITSDQVQTRSVEVARQAKVSYKRISVHIASGK